jgi:hypothetical protein
MAKPGVVVMMEPIAGVQKPAAEPPAPLPARAVSPQGRDQTPGVLDLRPDRETMHLHTEMRDPEADRVLLRLRAIYHGDNKADSNDLVEA